MRSAWTSFPGRPMARGSRSARRAIPTSDSARPSSFYVLDLADLHVRKLLESGGPNGNPKWSPDGKQIAYTTANGQQFFYLRQSLHRRDSRRRRRAARTDAEFDEDPNLIDWGADGIYFSPCRRPPRTSSASIPATKAMHRLSGPDAFHAAGASFTKDHRTLAAVGAAPNHFAEIFVSSAPISRQDTSPTSRRSTRISRWPRAKWCSGNRATARRSKAS